MTLDGRDGGYGISYKRTITSSIPIPSDLLILCKNSLYITAEHFDTKLSGLIRMAISEFERITGTSLLEQEIELRYEYFKGKNKIPFEPHIAVDEVADFTLSGIDSVQYLEGGTGDPLTITYTAGYADNIIPTDILDLIALLVGYWFKNESEVGKCPVYIYSQIKKYNVNEWV